MSIFHHVCFQTAFKTPVLVTPPASNTPTDPTNTITPDITALSISEPDDQVKQQMIQAMAQQSGMNLEWSQRFVACMNFFVNWFFGIYISASTSNLKLREICRT